MALEAVIQQLDPFIYGHKDYNYSTFEMGSHGSLDLDEALLEQNPNAHEVCSTTAQYWDISPPSSVARIAASSPESRRKRRRNKTLKNKEQMENQRMTHIAVERNRRRQMNDYLAVLRSLMPPSYVQRGDQASIVGGAINFVKELEQLIQSLEAHKLTDGDQQKPTDSNIFSDFFNFPQFSMQPSANSPTTVEVARSNIAEIEVTMVESHANIKILTKKRPKQLLKIVAKFHYIRLNILHLNVTTVDQSVIYSFSVKVEDECELTTVNEIAKAVHEMVGMIQEETTSTRI